MYGSEQKKLAPALVEFKFLLRRKAMKMINYYMIVQEEEKP